nr:AMP-binding protein [Pseudomonas sp. BP8]
MFAHAPSAVRQAGVGGRTVWGDFYRVPIFNTVVQLLDGDRIVPVGEVGEFVDCGPLVMKGYWDQPQATEVAIRDGWLRTGEVGFMDENGWF